MNEAEKLNSTVIKNGFCIGCGVCAYVDESSFKVKWDEISQLSAVAVGNLELSYQNVSRICPFSEDAKTEDEVGEIYFKEVQNKHNAVGKYISCFAGYVREDQFRELGTSGGIGKWLGYWLLKYQEIEYFIQVNSNIAKKANDTLFEYKIYSVASDVMDGSKSAYYPVSMVNVLKFISNNDGRYAITGIPCFVKALRLLSQNDPIIQNRIKYIIGIVCGSMKSAYYSKLIAWQLDVHPNHLKAIDFREKLNDKPTYYQGNKVWSRIDNETRMKTNKELFGTDYGMGFFKQKACDYCDDVLAETADISIGDAWLDKYVNDTNGTSIIVARNKKVLEILNAAKENRLIHLDDLSVEDIATSQYSSLRHRREGLSYRLKIKQKNGEWTPLKRISPNQFKISRKRRNIYKLRERISIRSHVSFKKALSNDNIEGFLKEMNPLVRRYYRTLDGSRFEKLLFKLLTRFRKAINMK